jgi:hypothetical protein
MLKGHVVAWLAFAPKSRGGWALELERPEKLAGPANKKQLAAKSSRGGENDKIKRQRQPRKPDKRAGRKTIGPKRLPGRAN